MSPRSTDYEADALNCEIVGRLLDVKSVQFFTTKCKLRILLMFVDV